MYAFDRIGNVSIETPLAALSSGALGYEALSVLQLAEQEFGSDFSGARGRFLVDPRWGMASGLIRGPESSGTDGAFRAKQELIKCEHGP